MILLIIIDLAIFMPILNNLMCKVVGMAGFEPTTTTPPV